MFVSVQYPGVCVMSSKCLFRRSYKVIRTVVFGAAALAIAGCSTDAKRFADYPPVNKTASLPDKSNDPVSSTALNGANTNATKPSWQNGSTAAQTAIGSVTVKPGQTMFSIAKANGMSAEELASANGISAPYTLRSGQSLRVPGVADPVSPAPSFRPQVRAAYAPANRPNYAGSGVHRVTAGETLFSLGRRYNVHPYKIARSNGLSNSATLKVGQTIKIPARGQGFASAPSSPSASVPAPQTTTARNTAQPSAPALPDVPKPPAQTQVSQAPTQTESAAMFRWPVRGREISSYGTKPNGTRNEGINISVPEGTSVRSAESGIVAYAGNELKGYGNLVLIRHNNGWVTAYAHNRELFVKRGDTVKRGEIIAKAGQTGSVDSPQLHFEVRKGASAVDPMRYLSSQTASN